MRLANVKTETPFFVDFNCIMNSEYYKLHNLAKAII